MKIPQSKFEGLDEVAEPEIDTEGSWAISYGDLLTLLVAFFILFFSTNPDKAREDVLSSSLFSSLYALSVPDAAQIEESSYAASGRYHTGLDEKVSVSLGARIERRGRRLFVEFPNVSFFDSAKIELTSEGRQVLEKFTRLYIPYAAYNSLNIIGFSDERPLTSTWVARDNLELSVLRSLSTQRYLTSLGIPVATMRIAGHGVYHTTVEEEQAKLLPNELVENYARARRVVLMIEPEGGT